MVTSTYSADVSGINDAVKEAVRDDGSVQVRVQPQLLQQGGRYLAWRGVSWTVRCSGAKEAIAVREVLRLVFGAVTLLGPERVAQALKGLVRAEKGGTEGGTDENLQNLARPSGFEPLTPRLGGEGISEEHHSVEK